jgi:hypothetical protein
MRLPALLFLLLGACTSAADDELVALKHAHSIVAEWASVTRLAAAGRVSETYARETAAAARTQLASDSQELRVPNGPAAQVIDGLGADPGTARLTAAAQALGSMELMREGR